MPLLEMVSATIPMEFNKNQNKATLRGEPQPNSMMYSILFFWVGSSVKHNMQGIGVVQIPPGSGSGFSRKMLVRVWMNWFIRTIEAVQMNSSFMTKLKHSYHE